METNTNLDTSHFYTDPKTGTTYTSADVAKQYGVTVPSLDTLGTQTPLDVNSTLPKTDSNPASTTVAGATSTTKSLQDYIKELTPPNTDTQNTADKLTSDISTLLGQDTGKDQAQADAEKAAGADVLKKQLVDLNAQILSRSAEYDATNTNLENPNNPQQLGIPMNAIIGQQAQVQKAKASEIGLLQARALGLQGQVQFAIDTATKAVDLKYAVIEDQLKVKQAQLKLLEPTLSKEEAVTAAALTRQYADQQQKIADEKQKAKDNLSLAINSQIKTRYANNKGEIFDTTTGVAFPNAAAFFKATGVTSFEDAYAKGLVSDVTTGADYSKYPASYQEYILAKQGGGFSGTYNDYLNYDANRKKSVTNNITPEQKTVDKFNAAVASWDKKGTREQFTRQLQAAYPDIDANDISRKVGETYPNGYDSGL